MSILHPKAEFKGVSGGKVVSVQNDTNPKAKLPKDSSIQYRLGMSALSLGVLFPLSFTLYLNRLPLSYVLDASHKSYIHSEIVNGPAWTSSWSWVIFSFVFIFILSVVDVAKPFWPKFAYKIGLIVWALVCVVVLGNVVQLGMSNQYETNNQKTVSWFEDNYGLTPVVSDSENGDPNYFSGSMLTFKDENGKLVTGRMVEKENARYELKLDKQ